ncbi:MAG: tyrosine-type recombinase/integrase [Bacteroidales bacterium]|nr:tyrosine-type recombinase/integrase [Candidatus Sodaliphilus aphodohippi]
MPLNPVIERFLHYLDAELNYSALTVAAYRNDLAQWTEALTAGTGEPDFASVTTSDIRAWMVQRSGRGDCPRTLRRKLQSVRSLYRYLMSRGEVDANPAAAVELAKVPKPLPSMVREKNIDALLDSEVDMDDFEQVRNRLIIMMFYETGIRRAELIGLLDRNVDTAKGELRVHGKRDKDRVVPFGSELRDWIGQYRRLRAETGATDDEFFVREHGGKLYPSLVYRVVHDGLRMAGASGKTSPHVLRHSFASSMLNGGAGLGSVKELLGHESLATTQIYTHITFSELQHNYKLAHPRALKKGE